MALEAERAWFGRLCTTYAKHSPASDKMTKRLMITEMKLTIVPKWHKAFLKNVQVTPYVHCRFT